MRLAAVLLLVAPLLASPIKETRRQEPKIPGDYAQSQVSDVEQVQVLPEPGTGFLILIAFGLVLFRYDRRMRG